MERATGALRCCPQNSPPLGDLNRHDLQATIVRFRTIRTITPSRKQERGTVARQQNTGVNGRTGVCFRAGERWLRAELMDCNGSA